MLHNVAVWIVELELRGLHVVGRREDVYDCLEGIAGSLHG